MSEVIPFPAGNIEKSVESGELDKHFESQIEAQEALEQEKEETIGFLQRTFPTIFMKPDEVVSYLESIRGRVEEIEKQAA